MDANTEEIKLEDAETDSDCSDDRDSTSPELSGNLQKWTNYIHGWQDRYFVLKDGCLSYFKDKSELATGSRGSISLAKAVVKEHEFDELRFDIGVNDSLWYCRTKDREERKVWLDAIELQKNDSGIDSTLSRNGSMFSLNSISSGNMVSVPGGKGKRSRAQEMKSILSEIETLRNLSHQLIGKLEKQAQFVPMEKQNGDCGDSELSMYRADTLTFKSTIDNLLELCQQCAELSTMQDDKLKAKYEREYERRKRFEELYRTLLSQRNSPGPARDGPDFIEGPRSALTDEMWFDAVDSAMEKLDEVSYQESRPQKSMVKTPLSIGTQRMQHRYSGACDNYVTENLKYAFSSGDQIDGEDGWELMHSEGEMRVYRKEVEIDGVVLDPLKATHQVNGITAEEMVRWFFDPDVKMEWEGHLLERVKVLELLAPDTVIMHSVMKRVWPSAQRDIVYLSHIRHVSAHDATSNENDTWIVCNYTVEHPDAKIARGVVRCTVRASMVCQTIILSEAAANENVKNKKFSRDQVACKVWYTADVNPGGWAPAKVLRQIYKHEYPKFLTKFGQYVYNKVAPTEPEVTIPTSLDTC